jgi:hypothetical protein
MMLRWTRMLMPVVIVGAAYLISRLSATGPAKIEPQKPQKLS